MGHGLVGEHAAGRACLHGLGYLHELLLKEVLDFCSTGKEPGEGRGGLGHGDVGCHEAQKGKLERIGVEKKRLLFS